MPGFFTAHTIGEISKEALRERAEKMVSGTADEPVELVRLVCDFEAGRLLCEWVAHTRQEVLDYLAQHELTLSGDDEWIIHVDMEEPPASPPVNLESPD